MAGRSGPYADEDVAMWFDSIVAGAGATSAGAEATEVGVGATEAVDVSIEVCVAGFSSIARNWWASLSLAWRCDCESSS